MSTKRVADEALVTDADLENPRKLRKKSVTAKSLGISKEEYSLIKALPLKRELKKYVKKFAALVEEDWNDGVETQTKALKEWAAALQKPMQSVVEIGVGRGLAFIQCHDVLKVMGDSWRDVRSCRSQVHPQKMLEGFQMELVMPWGETVRFAKFGELCPLRDMCGFVWRMLLRNAAGATGGIEEAVLFQAIKDATDNGVLLASREVGPENIWDQGPSVVGNSVARPDPRPEALDKLVAMKEKWMRLDSTIRTFRPRRVIDRRQRNRSMQPDKEGVSEASGSAEGVKKEPKEETFVPQSMSSAYSATMKADGLNIIVQAKEEAVENYNFEDNNENAMGTTGNTDGDDLYMPESYTFATNMDEVVEHVSGSLPGIPDQFWSKQEDDCAETVTEGVTESSTAPSP